MENWYLKYCFKRFFFGRGAVKVVLLDSLFYLTAHSGPPRDNLAEKVMCVCLGKGFIWLTFPTSSSSFWGGEGKFKLYYIYKPRSKARIDTLLACLQLFVLSQFLRLSALQAQPIKWCHTHSGSVFLPQITINKTPERRSHSQQLSNADSSSIKTLPGWS